MRTALSAIVIYKERQHKSFSALYAVVCLCKHSFMEIGFAPNENKVCFA